MTDEEFKKYVNDFENDDLEFRLDLKELPNKKKCRAAKTAVSFCNTRQGR